MSTLTTCTTTERTDTPVTSTNDFGDLAEAPAVEIVGPGDQLPERPTLDPRSAIALAVNTELDLQLANQEAAVVIDPRPVADAVLAALDIDAPRIPRWTGDPRTVGGGRPAGTWHPEPLITVAPEPDDRGGWRTGYVCLEVEMGCDHAATVTDRAVVPVEDAEAWLLAGLAACRAARERS